MRLIPSFFLGEVAFDILDGFSKGGYFRNLVLDAVDDQCQEVFKNDNVFDAVEEL